MSFLVLSAVRTAWAQLTSTNWAGYAIISIGITGISASWTIPGITQCSTTGPANIVSQGLAVWIGFDGLTNKEVPEQLGTISECWNGSPTYYTWEEDSTHGVGTTNHAVMALYNAVSAGDHITASIAYLGNNQFQLRIADSETGDSRTFSVIVSNSPRASAEWIVEAFSNINTQSQVTLPKFQPITFSDCGASVNNAVESISQLNGQPINMVDSKNNMIATVQGLNQAGTSFNVAEVSPVPEAPFILGLLLPAFAVGILVLRKKNLT